MEGQDRRTVSSLRNNYKRIHVPLCECVHTPVRTCRGQPAGSVSPSAVGLPLGVGLCSKCFYPLSISRARRSVVLDDEDDPAEAEKEGTEMEDEELDPLDAYMEEVKEEVKKFNMRSVKGGAGNEKVLGGWRCSPVSPLTCRIKS